MSDPNQGAPAEPQSDSWNPADPGAAALPPPDSPGADAGRGDLRPWLLAMAAIGIAGLLFRQVELAAFSVLAGLFAVTHAVDLDPSRRHLDRALSWIVPVLGAIVFFALGSAAAGGGSPAGVRALAIGLAGLGVLLSLATAHPSVAAALARRLFRVASPSLTLQLAARLALLGLMIYPISIVALPQLLDALAEREGDLVGPGSLWGNLIGLTLLAFGGVGLGVRRDLRASLERLGVRALRPRDAVVAVLGVGALILLNAGAESAQHRWLPELWERDQQVNRLITSGLDRSDALLLGISAGVGEEMALRGALQPRLGIFMTALVFACLHLHYSWFGVATILLIGILLGIIRQRTNTSVAILVHAVYDIFAVLTFRP